ncbi:MAG: ribosomal-processing cysteine protease Prp [Leptospirales bacterium]|nr:ribosomal-processing cysteine protease Prp [Leptospirales bacterium]
MTRVLFRQTGGTLFLKVEGHSIKTTAVDLCSAISILTENLEASLTLLLRKTPRVIKSDGYFEIDTEDDSGSNLLFASALLGLRTLAKQYPSGLHVET